jgi:hypothetical protein
VVHNILYKSPDSNRENGNTELVRSTNNVRKLNKLRWEKSFNWIGAQETLPGLMAH